MITKLNIKKHYYRRLTNKKAGKPKDLPAHC